MKRFFMPKALKIQSPAPAYIEFAFTMLRLEKVQILLTSPVCPKTSPLQCPRNSLGVLIELPTSVFSGEIITETRTFNFYTPQRKKKLVHTPRGGELLG